MSEAYFSQQDLMTFGYILNLSILFKLFVLLYLCLRIDYNYDIFIGNWKAGAES